MPNETLPPKTTSDLAGLEDEPTTEPTASEPAPPQGVEQAPAAPETGKERRKREREEAKAAKAAKRAQKKGKKGKKGKNAEGNQETESAGVLPRDSNQLLRVFKKQQKLRAHQEQEEAQRMAEEARRLRKKARQKAKFQDELARHGERVEDLAPSLGFDPGRPVTEIPDVPDGMREEEFQVIREDLAFVRILYEPSSNTHVYQVIEPSLNRTETEIYTFLRETLIRTLDGRRDQHGAIDWEQILTDAILQAIVDHEILIDDVGTERIRYHLVRDFLGFGPIDVLMQDPMLEDVSCDGPHVPLYLFHRKYESVRSTVIFDDELSLDSFVIRLAQRSGKHISVSDPLLDATLPDGSRLQATLAREVSTRGSSFTIRKFRADPFTPPDLIRYGSMSPEMAAFFWMVMEEGDSLLVAGGTASGKTTTLNAISQFIPPEKKIVSIEDTREINLHHENWIAGVTRSGFGGQIIGGKPAGTIDMYKLLEAALRQRPEYLVVGEVRGPEALTLFQAMATGHAVYSTMHADSVSSAVYRLENPPINVPRMMLQTVDVMLIQRQVRIGSKMTRRVTEVTEFVGFDPDTGELLTNTVFQWNRRKDKHDFLGKSDMMEQYMEHRGLDPEGLQEEWKRRILVLQWMGAAGLNSFEEVTAAIADYYANPDELLARIEQQMHELELEAPEAPDLGAATPAEPVPAAPTNSALDWQVVDDPEEPDEPLPGPASSIPAAKAWTVANNGVSQARGKPATLDGLNAAPAPLPPPSLPSSSLPPPPGLPALDLSQEGRFAPPTSTDPTPAALPPAPGSELPGRDLNGAFEQPNKPESPLPWDPAASSNFDSQFGQPTDAQQAPVPQNQHSQGLPSAPRPAPEAPLPALGAREALSQAYEEPDPYEEFAAEPAASAPAAPADTWSAPSPAREPEALHEAPATSEQEPGLAEPIRPDAGAPAAPLPSEPEQLHPRAELPLSQSLPEPDAPSATAQQEWHAENAPLPVSEAPPELEPEAKPSTEQEELYPAGELPVAEQLPGPQPEATLPAHDEELYLPAAELPLDAGASPDAPSPAPEAPLDTPAAKHELALASPGLDQGGAADASPLLRAEKADSPELLAQQESGLLELGGFDNLLPPSSPPQEPPQDTPAPRATPDPFAQLSAQHLEALTALSRLDEQMQQERSRAQPAPLPEAPAMHFTPDELAGLGALASLGTLPRLDDEPSQESLGRDKPAIEVTEPEARLPETLAPEQHHMPDLDGRISTMFAGLWALADRPASPRDTPATLDVEVPSDFWPEAAPETLAPEEPATIPLADPAAPAPPEVPAESSPMIPDGFWSEPDSSLQTGAAEALPNSATDSPQPAPSRPLAPTPSPMPGPMPAPMPGPTPSRTHATNPADQQAQPLAATMAWNPTALPLQLAPGPSTDEYHGASRLEDLPREMAALEALFAPGAPRDGPAPRESQPAEPTGDGEAESDSASQRRPPRPAHDTPQTRRPARPAASNKRARSKGRARKGRRGGGAWR